MPSVSATLSWAIPIRAETLGAHVEAYVKLLPAITTLRLCHRFAANSAISRLPVELLNNIEEHLTNLERADLIKTWDQNFKCSQGLCFATDHLTAEELRPWEAKNASGELLKIDPDLEYTAESDRVDVYLLTRRSDLWEGRCSRNQRKFEEITAASTGLFEKNARLLRSHFGLDIWTTFVEIQYRGAHGNHKELIAYLILPNAEKGSREFVPTMYDHDTGCKRQDGFAINVTQPGLDDGARKRFGRALRILGLQPETPKSQQPSTGCGKPELRKETSVWPKLTMLVSTKHDPEEWPGHW